MDSESKKLLEETLELAQENNKMLHKMKRSMNISSAMSFIYWLFIIGSAVGAYYYIQPYISEIESVYTKATDTVNTIKNFGK